MEKPVQFDNEGVTLRGILHLPDEGCPRGLASLGVVFLHGWSGSRLGPHRMFVKMARRLTEQGGSCLRFDFRGRGESDGETRGSTIRGMASDANAAVAFLQNVVQIKKVVVLGICSGGKVAITSAAHNPAIAGLALWSCESMGDIKTSSVNARKTLHALRQYARKLLSPAIWKKILLGRVNAGFVGKAVLGHETADAVEIEQEKAVFREFLGYKGCAQFVYGENDPETKVALEGYKGACERVGLPAEFHVIKGANHSYYALDWEEEVMALTERWLSTLV